jgi:hypothetical protein
MTEVDELLARVEWLESEAALRRLAHDYCIGADAQDGERWDAVWTDDAVWQVDVDDEHTFRGRAAIRAAVEHQWRIFPRMQHATSNHDVRIDGDRATGRCDVVSIVQLPDLRWLVGGGTYLDEYRRDLGIWRIALRRVDRPFDLAPLVGLQDGRWDSA